MMQVKLSGCSRNGGSGVSAATDEIEADIRIIAATNRDLPEVRGGREFAMGRGWDLYYLD